MTLLRLNGIRGGVGVTSVLAALAQALHRLGQRVLLVDLSPNNMLGLHFELPFAHVDGWARGENWREKALELQPGLCLLPYGRLVREEQERLELWFRNRPGEWNRRLSGLRDEFDWVLFDAPQALPGHAESLEPDLDVRLIRPDMGCQVLLHQQPEPEWLLINGHDPASRLQQDLLLLWRRQFAGRLLPLALHQDETMAEALAHKLPLGTYAPLSETADRIHSLAVWCMGKRSQTC
ncbi:MULTISPECIES: cellulose biosynthesis protein BcsQ [Oceanimonas]|uniref:Cellulose synthase operon protein YhjQ n=1 Tax=Oceanimonas doudoroffii TaxID=84158 RepID=A0A233RJ47_9GAMM|nr:MULTISPECIES: cellulose biosynthesis protein BcsQ [Oceanimonas]NHH99979.1 hypothetical protein [Oceanimonas sp. MB9]OXY83415.1 cellulose synthase operon protein YhjQ [Oceanimonas doudoroffii]